MIHDTEYVRVEVPVPYEVIKKEKVEVPVRVEVPVPYEVIKEVKVPYPVEVKVPEIHIEKVMEPAPPVPVIVKTIHDTQVITEEPTEIHHVELKPEPVKVTPPPPVRAAIPPPPPPAKGFNWWWLLLLLCCLPLCFLPFLCCKGRKKYYPAQNAKPVGTIAGLA